MGIKKLGDFLKKEFAGTFLKKSPEDFKGKRIAIDGNFMVYKFLAIEISRIINSLLDPINDEISQEAMISALTKRFLLQEKTFLEYEVQSFWFFDGEAPQEKEKTKEARIKAKIASKNKLKIAKEEFELIDEFDFAKKEKAREEILKRRAATTTISRDSIRKIIDNLKEFGVAADIARSEGELHCASFCVHGLADYVFTTDTDVFAIGASRLTSFTSGGVELIEIQDILKACFFTQDQFRDFCILLGCDFNEKLSRVNETKTFFLMMEHEKIENIPNAVTQKSLNYESCRKLLTAYPIEEHEYPESCDSRHEKIKSFLFGK